MVAAAKPAKRPPSNHATHSVEPEAKPPAPSAPAAGLVRLAISPWGQVEVDGTPVGTAPPLNEITLSEGKHHITVHNGDFPPYNATVTVTPGRPATIKYKFGS